MTERDHHGNPTHFAEYLARLDDPERDSWQRPDDVVRALALEPGMVVCDVGAGPGYFALRLARAVGPEGRVYAIDAEARMLEELASRAERAGLGNVIARLARDGRELPPELCDRVLLVNALHHIPDAATYLRALAGALRPGGRVVVIDFRGGEQPIGPPEDHKLSREAFLRLVEQAGLRVEGEETFLPYQYFASVAPG